MSEQHPIDDLFRKQLDNRLPEFKEEYWLNAEKLLDKHASGLLHKPWWKGFFPVAVSVIVAAGVGFYFGRESRDVEKENRVEQQVISMQEETEAQNKSKASASTTSPLVNQKDTANAAANIIAPQSDTVLYAGKTNRESTGFKKGASILVTDSVFENGSGIKNTSGNNAGYVRSKTTAMGKADAAGSASIPLQKSNAIERNNVAGEIQGTASSSESEKNEKVKKDGAGTIGKDDASASSSIKTVFNYHTDIGTGEVIDPFMNSLFISSMNLNVDEEPLFNRTVNSSNSIKFLHRNQWSKVRSFEFSGTAGATLVTVPYTKSAEAGYEWNAMFNYRINNWVGGTGIGQFSVADNFSGIVDSILDHSFYEPIITIDSIFTLDSTYQFIDSIWVWIYDTTFQVTQDTSLQYVENFDTVAQEKEYISSGHYLEIPLLIGYRFNIGKMRLQLSAGAAYGWYSGTLRYIYDVEGRVTSYKPGSIVSILGRVYLQYPIQQKIFLQAYSGVRYAIGLKNDIPENNYLIYSLGIGLLYRF